MRSVRACCTIPTLEAQQIEVRIWPREAQAFYRDLWKSGELRSGAKLITSRGFMQAAQLEEEAEAGRNRVAAEGAPHVDILVRSDQRDFLCEADQLCSLRIAAQALVAE